MACIVRSGRMYAGELIWWPAHLAATTARKMEAIEPTLDNDVKTAQVQTWPASTQLAAVVLCVGEHRKPSFDSDHFEIGGHAGQQLPDLSPLVARGMEPGQLDQRVVQDRVARRGQRRGLSEPLEGLESETVSAVSFIRTLAA